MSNQFKTFEEEVNFYIKWRQIYYINYPELGDEEIFWKDGDGEIQIIVDMSVEHIARCIKLLKKDIIRLKKSGASDSMIDLIKNKINHLEKGKGRKIENMF
jgi:hypothetical protein